MLRVALVLAAVLFGPLEGAAHQQHQREAVGPARHCERGAPQLRVPVESGLGLAQPAGHCAFEVSCPSAIGHGKQRHY